MIPEGNRRLAHWPAASRARAVHVSRELDRWRNQSKIAAMAAATPRRVRKPSTAVRRLAWSEPIKRRGSACDRPSGGPQALLVVVVRDRLACGGPLRGAVEDAAGPAYRHPPLHLDHGIERRAGFRRRSPTAWPLGQRARKTVEDRTAGRPGPVSQRSGR